ncbi:uncharacterized protein LOC131231526 [Magnolia sinica]|uniref:uncharacterized protein LOC131231526 n=1 Tax=Magnolia sinica TaxID=86752 RepID=UPI00265893A1|nr:uncharacterized protein LOC131231526 [Magnolia sinica]
MLRILNRKLWHLYSNLRWRIRRPAKTKIVIRRFGQPTSKTHLKVESNGSHHDMNPKPIRIATFNAAMFSMAPAIPKSDEECYPNSSRNGVELDIRSKSANNRPKSILKRSSTYSYSTGNSVDNLSKQQRFGKSKLRVSINLPDNEISLERTRQLNFTEDDKAVPSIMDRNWKGKAPMKSSWSFNARKGMNGHSESSRSNRTVLDVLKEVNPDILALQDVKADEEKGMSPLSDLADALGMKYVFGESWAPEYGNAVLSKWPIKRWKVQKIIDDTDFRNVLKATIDVPQVGEVNFHCTHLDHLDENWRMKQISAIIQSEEVPHILAGGLNSLDEMDYSAERWIDIVKYYEEIGKPTPKVEVMRFLKGKKYQDAKNFSGECEPVVMIAKGQAVQGTCKYGTRVDYILASPNSPYHFVPNSYTVMSSKGTSDHHIVKVDIMFGKAMDGNDSIGRRRQHKKRVVKMTNPSSSRGIWGTNS